MRIDASAGEGGGQLVRTAIALAAIAGCAVELTGIRARRRRPGLARQHLAAVRAVAERCGARCTGAEAGSSFLRFEPSYPPRGGESRIEIGSAGSVTLVLQALLPVLAVAESSSRVVVTGGTDVPRAPPWDYFTEIFLPLVARFGVQAQARLLRRGYYPRGGGAIELEVWPQPLRAWSPEIRGDWHVHGTVHVARLAPDVAERMRAGAIAVFDRATPISVHTRAAVQSDSAGGAILLRAETDDALLGYARVAERGVRAEGIGRAVACALAADLATQASLDVCAADQLAIYYGLAASPARYRVRALSLHARTALWLVERLRPVRFRAERAGDVWSVEVATATARAQARTEWLPDLGSNQGPAD